MKKKVIGAVAVALVGVVTAGTILSHLSETAYAQESFVGIDSIIEEHDDSNPFTIVEIVPDHGLAKIGYFVEGSEPFYYNADTGAYQSWQEHLVDLDTAAKRTAYMSTLEKELASITTSFSSEKELEKAKKVTTALSYVPYEESYNASSGAQTITLAQALELTAGTSGYAMKDVGDGKGNFTLEDGYYLAADGETGTYAQNISYYSTTPTNAGEYYYNLTFQAYDTDPASDAVVYIVESAEAVDSASLTSEPASWNDIYYYSADDGVYVKAESAVDGVTDYYRVTFQHTVVEEKSAADGNNDTQKIVYYQVSSEKFDSTKSSTYGAVLDSQNSYVEKADGHFIYTKAYTQVAEGEGNYNITESDDGSLDGPVHIEKVYYTGGFVNNDVFKQTVFNQSGLLDKAGAADISIRVLAMTPGEYEKYEGETDLLYLSNSSSLVKDKSGLAAYGAGNDLDDMTVDMLFEQVISESVYLPVIVDYSIMSDSGLAGTGVKKLAQLLTAADLSASNLNRTIDGDGNITVTVSGSVTEFEDKNNDHFYVRKNVLVVPGESDKFQFMDNFDHVFLDDSGAAENTFQTDATNIGFGDIATTIITENTYRKVENDAGSNYGLYSQTISKAIATEYIISYVEKRVEYSNKDLRILDVEPCTIYSAEKPSYYTDATTSWYVAPSDPNQAELDLYKGNREAAVEAKIKKMLGVGVDNYNPSIEVVHMSSAEFISKVEDLGEYDMIYFGLYTDQLNTVDGRTVYNDSSMNGLVYTNIGDIRNAYYTAGLLDTDYNNESNHYAVDNLGSGYYDNNLMGLKQDATSDHSSLTRYSGNDLTEEKKEAVINYLKSGSPVVLADNFLAKDANGNTYVYDFEYNADGTVTNGYIDNCSRMYELINKIKDMSNVMTESSVSSAVLKRYITLGKPRLTVDAGATVSGEKYYNTVGNQIIFNFSIENYGSADANATFYVSLYADYNADGRYAASENITASNYKITLDGETQAVKTKTDDDGNKIYYYELSPTDSSTSYRLTYTMSDDYVGVLPIKLKVSQSNNVYRYDSEQIYFYKDADGKIVNIRVLQILPERGSNECNLGEKGVYDGNLDPGSEFYNQLHSEAMKAYNITIHAIKANKYAQKYAADNSFLDDYDMLIIGFADCYGFNMSDKELVAAYQGIGDFIATGKSVLFTHDTTSYSDKPNQGDWAGLMNQLLGADVGFDRYGVFSSNLISAGIKNLTSDSDTVYNVNDYYSLKKAKAEGTLTKDSYTGAELFQLIVDEAKANSKDIAYKPNSNKTELVTEVQGRSSMTINGNSGGQYANVNNLGWNMQTEKVELVNEGQILVYPFNILDQMKKEGDSLTMPVVQTHGQYYQIDMNEDADNDGESDVTVWLSLCGSWTQYESAQRDARNNYYIYTKGNITYSGVGHSNMNQTSNVTEIQLYINTMVTAYSAGAHAPTISLQQGADSSSGKLNTIYVGMDSKVSDGSLEDADGNKIVEGEVVDGEQVDSGYERIYYTIDDTNVTQGGTKRVAVKYYLVFDTREDAPEGLRDKGSYLTINETKVFAIEQNWTTYKGDKTDPESSLNNITVGTTYACDVPYDILSEVVTVDGEKIKVSLDEATIWVTATTNIWRQGVNADTKTPSGSYPAYDYIKVQRVGLFDLD